MPRLLHQGCLISAATLLPMLGPGCVDNNIDTTGNNAESDGCNNDCGPPGSAVWCKYDIGEDGNSNVANSVSVDSQGNALLVGHVNNKTSHRFEVIVAKYSPDGDQLWLKRIPGTGQDSPSGYGSAVDAKDRILVSAEFASRDQRTPTLMRSSPSGELEWTKTVDETMVFANNNLTLSSSDRIAVFGHSDTVPAKAFIADLGTDGTLAWTRSLDDIKAGSRAYALASDQDGDWLLGGDVLTKSLPTGEDTQPQEFFAGFIRRYSPTGDEVWTRNIPAPDDDLSIHLTGVTATPEMPIIALWNTTQPCVGSGTRMSLGKLDASGVILSQTTIPVAAYSIGGAALQAGPGGDFFIAGTITPGDPNGPSLVGSASRHKATASTMWLYQNDLVPRSSSFTSTALASPDYMYVAGNSRNLAQPRNTNPCVSAQAITAHERPRCHDCQVILRPAPPTPTRLTALAYSAAHAPSAARPPPPARLSPRRVDRTTAG